MILLLYCDVSPEVAELFALIFEDPEGRLKKVETPKDWAPQIHLEDKGKNHNQFSRRAVKIFTPRCTNSKVDHWKMNHPVWIRGSSFE